MLKINLAVKYDTESLKNLKCLIKEWYKQVIFSEIKPELNPLFQEILNHPALFNWIKYVFSRDAVKPWVICLVLEHTYADARWLGMHQDLILCYQTFKREYYTMLTYNNIRKSTRRKPV
jgi:hypothetical protein